VTHLHHKILPGKLDEHKTMADSYVDERDGSSGRQRRRGALHLPDSARKIGWTKEDRTMERIQPLRIVSYGKNGRSCDVCCEYLQLRDVDMARNGTFWVQ
jgi:hypothetical protein